MIVRRRLGDVIFMGVGGLVLAVAVWLLVLGRQGAAVDTTGRPQVRVSGGYVVAAPSSVSAFFTLRNAGSGADRLLGVRTDLSTVVMVHRDVWMVSLDSVPLPAHHTVAFAPRGLHIMIMQPRRTLQVGDTVRLTLVFSRSAPQTITAPVVHG